MLKKLRKHFTTSAPDPSILTYEDVELALPVAWLLGKTGAGKSSIVRALTGLSEVEIGSGFRPCTATAERFDYPPDAPLLRFLDTRGLGETGYVPDVDLGMCENHSHAVLLVARLDDPVQGEVAEALGEVLQRRARLPVLLVHTGADLLADRERERARAANTQLFEKHARRELPQIEVALSLDAESSVIARERLVEGLLEILPAAGLLFSESRSTDGEEQAWAAVRKRVLFYAGLAGTSDVAPLVGAVTVPAAQLAMLRELARHYKISWSRRMLAQFLGALGAGVAAKFGAGYGLRQLAKLIPVYGQTVGAAVAGSVSFATTYALGRVAAKFLYLRSVGRSPSEGDLRATYQDALKRASPDAR